PTSARQLFGTNFFAEPYIGIFLLGGGLDSAQSPLASSEAFYYPTLRSDKPDYSPGEIVTLMGERWRPNETITINIHESSGDPDTNLTATADVSGSFTNQQFIVQPSDLGVRFLATATGQTSNWTAQATFTDGNVKAMAAPSGTTFTLTKSTFSNTTCSGTPASTTTVTGVNSSSGNTTGGVNAGESIKLEAAATSDQNTAFTNWSSSDPFTVVAPRAICVPGFSGGGTRNYFANYAPGGADLSITKTDSPDPVTPGGTLTYTITVSNAGPNAAASVTMNDPLPPQTTFQSMPTPAGWSCTTPAAGSTGTVNCTTASLASAATATFTLGVQVSSAALDGSTISNTATVSSTTADSNTGNNSATATTTVRAQADLAITKTDSPDPVTPGGTLTYTITVSNAGPNAAASVTMNDPLPSQTTFQSMPTPAGWSCTTPAAGSTGIVNCTTASFASGATATFTLMVQVS